MDEMMKEILGIGKEVVLYSTDKKTVKMRYDGPDAFTATMTVGDVSISGSGTTRGQALLRMDQEILERCKDLEFRTHLYEQRTGKSVPKAKSATTAGGHDAKG
jgi:hypothetical protein